MGVRRPAAISDGARWLRRFATTTPGAIGAVLIVTVVLCVLSGFVSANQLSDKMVRRDIVLERTEPPAYAAQSLYVALSAADAAGALSEAATGTSDAQTRSIVARITADLPAYAGLVETARTSYRDLAREADGMWMCFDLVDRANRIRPRTTL
ncbi:hypothetical protein [Nocardia sp. NPDC051463]|uniref:hypothetical protein n=1 Tax=Nocardia sp. NPDC051463 TaxID=3154845 RepID=UPI0034143472